MLQRSDAIYGRDARDRLAEASGPTVEGARAALETFYRAFNGVDLALLARVWVDDPLAQLNNPLGGLLHGHAAIAELYGRVFAGPGSAWVELFDVVEGHGDGWAVFMGRERGEYRRDGVVVPLAIRTSRLFAFDRGRGGWRQVHHHGSIDAPSRLAAYQRAVLGEEIRPAPAG